MVTQQALDQVPVLLVFFLFIVLGLLVYDAGFRVARWRQERTPDGEEEGPTGVLVGSLLALTAFLLAVTMGMASDRFDARRGLVLQEANTTESAYLRAGFLPPVLAERSRELLREYVPLRIVTDATDLTANIGRSEAIQAELWAIAEDVGRAASSDVLATYIESLNETIALHESRIAARVYARVPETVNMLLLGGSLLALATVAYSAGFTRRRSLVTAFVLVLSKEIGAPSS